MASPSKKAVNDVEQPGKTAASPTSKPVIVSNRPLIKDPMVVEEDADKKTETPLPLKGSSKARIQPLESSPKPEAETEAAESEPVTEAPEEAPASETSAESKPKPKSPSENEAAEAARQAEHQANLQKIIDAKTYYLPINAVEKRKTKRFVILGLLLSILLILAWVDIALDAGLITIDGVSPLTSFF